jgi:hypothetical protein
MQIELNELMAALSGKPQSTLPASRDLGTQIVVVDRGFVYVGKVSLQGDFAVISNARNLRKWGTSLGLGELVGGPTKETVLDQAGEVSVPMRAVIHFIKCSRDW